MMNTRKQLTSMVDADGVPGPALAGGSLFEAARSRNVSVDTSVSVGPPFWQTVEITECLELVRNTVLVMAK